MLIFTFRLKPSVVDTTHKDVCKLCVAECGVEVATIIGQSEEFQCVESTALAEHLEPRREDISDWRTHQKMLMDD